MAWNAGYASDIEYTAGYYAEQGPGYLNLVCVLNGVEPVPLDRPYTYFELGCGRGLTANVLAATNPQGRFYAADFNPSHIAGAQSLADVAQLDNLVLLENSFAELASGAVADLPQFDFITLHGIYSWVNAASRRHIVEFIARHLKPGGVVYLSYNAMPGWAPSLPLQRLLIEHAEAFPRRNDQQIVDAIGFAHQLAGQQAKFFLANSGAVSRLDSFKPAQPSYLVHEYLHRDWQPMYHVDVVRDLADAKLNYVGSAYLPHAYPALSLNQEQQNSIDAVPDNALRETLKDYFLNTSFRKDVFVRGARHMVAGRQAEWLGRVSLSLLVPRSAVSFKVKTQFGELNGIESVYGPVFDALAQRPHTLAELAQLPALATQSIFALGQIAAVLVTGGQVTSFFDAADARATASARRMNRSLTAATRYSDDYQVLCAPVASGGIGADYVTRLLTAALEEMRDAGAVMDGSAAIDIAELKRRAWQLLSVRGHMLIANGERAQNEQQNHALLDQLTDQFVQEKLPIWRHLGLC